MNDNPDIWAELRASLADCSLRDTVIVATKPERSPLQLFKGEMPGLFPPYTPPGRRVESE